MLEIKQLTERRKIMESYYKNILESVKTLAAVTVLYREGLKEQDIPDEEVERYTLAFVTAIIGGGNNRAN